MPHEPSVDTAPGSRRLPHITIESLASRIEELEHLRDSGEIDAIKAELEALRGSQRRLEARIDAIDGKIDALGTKIDALIKKVDKFDEVVGESPDDAAGTPGKGMKKTLSELNRASKEQPWSARIAAAMAAVLAIYQLLKGYGVLK